jgi:hypothetical protein
MGKRIECGQDPDTLSNGFVQHFVGYRPAGD